MRFHFYKAGAVLSSDNLNAFIKTPTLGWRSGALHVVGNIVGSGVFVCLAFQTHNHTPLEILFLWFIGGLIALCGALSYSELASQIPESGGEYIFLTRIYGKPVGFIAAWISSIAGFAAPIAASAYAAAEFAKPLFYSSEFSSLSVAVILVLGISFIHAFPKKKAIRVQNVMVVGKVLFLFAFIILGLLSPARSHAVFSLENFAPFKSSFAVALIFVGFAFTGWNAAVYITGEIKKPEKNVPRALFWGTLIVACLYVLLNFIFLYTTPVAMISGKQDFANSVAQRIVGSRGGNVLSLLISFGLLSSLSSMIWSGAEVMKAVGNSHTVLGTFSRSNKHGQPSFALLAQAMLSIFLLLSMSFEKILLCMGILLTLSSLLSVFGLFKLRKKQLPSFQCPFYPWVPLFFIAINLWILLYTSIENVSALVASFLICLAGVIIIFSRRIYRRMIYVVSEIFS